MRLLFLSLDLSCFLALVVMNILVLLSIVCVSCSLVDKLPILVTTAINSRLKKVPGFATLESQLSQYLEGLHLPDNLMSILKGDIGSDVAFLHLKRTLDQHIESIHLKPNKARVRHQIEAIGKCQRVLIKALRSYMSCIPPSPKLTSVMYDLQMIFATQAKLADDAVSGSAKLRQVLSEGVDVLENIKHRFLTIQRASVSDYLSTLSSETSLSSLYRAASDFYRLGRIVQLTLIGRMAHLKRKINSLSVTDLAEIRDEAKLCQIYQSGIFLIFPDTLARFGSLVVFKSGIRDPLAHAAVAKMQATFVETIGETASAGTGAQLIRPTLKFLKLGKSIDDIAKFL